MIHHVDGITAAHFYTNPDVHPDARTLDGTLSFTDMPPAMYLPSDSAAAEVIDPPHEYGATLIRPDQLHAYLWVLMLEWPLSQRKLASDSGVPQGTITDIFGERLGDPKVAEDDTPPAPPTVKFAVAFALHRVLSARTLGFSLVMPPAEPESGDRSLRHVDVENHPTALGKYFREVRRHRRLEVRPVAELAGTSKTKLSAFEHGKGGVPLPNTVDRYYSRGLSISTRFVIS